MRLIDADELPKYTGYALSADEVAIAVEKAPTIEAEPVRRGRWIKMSDADGIFYGCSECGEWHKEKSNYCPHCGARMEEGGRMMEQVNCSNCMVCAFKDNLCTSEICDRFRKRGNCEDFEGLLMNSIKRGRWLFKTNAFTTKDGSQFAGYTCSECGNAVWHGGRFCSNCGARMEEQE